MEKKIVAIGNSLGLVIDKSLRAQLGIKSTTVVRMTTDGKRLIVEPCGDRAEDSERRAEEALLATAAGERIHAIRIAEDLMLRWNVTNDDFALLTSGFTKAWRRIARYRGWIETTTWECLTDAEQRFVRRIEVFYWELRNDKDRDEAIAAALAAEPFDRLDPKERSVGSAR